MSETPTETSARSDRFRVEMAAMRVKTGAANREAPLQALSVLLMVAGVAMAFGAYQASLNVKATPGTNVDLLSSNSYLALAAAGITVTLVGGFLFLRYSLARFLRFWLLRQSYEQRVAIEDAMARRDGADPQEAGRSSGTS